MIMHRCFFSDKGDFGKGDYYGEDKGGEFLNVLCRQILYHIIKILKEWLPSIFSVPAIHYLLSKPVHLSLVITL